MSQQESRQVSEAADEHAERQPKQKRVIKRIIQPAPKTKTRQPGTGQNGMLAQTKPQSLPTPNVQTTGAEGGFTKWQTVIWREWCRCQDEDYAYYLFDLVKHTVFGPNFVVAMAIVGTLVGAIIGYLIGTLFANAGIQVGSWDLSALPPILLGWTMALAGGTIGVEGSRRFRSLYFWWKGQPSSIMVEKALREAVDHHPGAALVWSQPLQRLAQQKTQPNEPDQLIEALQSSDWVDRFVAQKTLVSLGGEAVASLKEVAADRSNPLWEMALWLLASIEQETANRFGWRAGYTFCPHCLTQFAARPVDITLAVSYNYYGCRVCGQSREYIFLPHRTVAVLDTGWAKVQAEQDGTLQVNWLHRRTLFDFDWVEILQASDEDVERFAVQVGNDTDPFRRSRYKQMRCFIGPDCKLSENTLRILHRTFGEVTQR